MYKTSLEIMWGYLHDRSDCVDEYLFVTDPYRYTSRFVDMLVENPEVISQLKSKIKIERMNSSALFSFFRGGYSMSELRILKMMKIRDFQEFLSQEFSELIFGEEMPKKLKNIK